MNSTPDMRYLITLIEAASPSQYETWTMRVASVIKSSGNAQENRPQIVEHLIYRDGDLRIDLNPSRATFVAWSETSEEGLRGAINFHTNDLLIWDAMEATHDQVSKIMTGEGYSDWHDYLAIYRIDESGIAFSKSAIEPLSATDADDEWEWADRKRLALIRTNPHLLRLYGKVPKIEIW